MSSFRYDATGALVGQVRGSGVSTAVTRDLAGRVTSIVHTGRGVVSSSLPSGVVNPSSGAPGNAFGHCKDNGNGHPNQQPAGCTTTQLIFGYTYDPRGLVATRDVSTDGVTTSTGYTHDALGRLTGSATGGLVSGYGWDASSNLVAESVSDDVLTPVGGDGYAKVRSVNAVNQVTSVVEDPFHLPSVHTATTGYTYDVRGNRTLEVTTRVTGAATHVVGRVTHTFDGMDLLTATTDAGSNLNSVKDDVTTSWVRDGAGRALCQRRANLDPLLPIGGFQCSSQHSRQTWGVDEIGRRGRDRAALDAVGPVGVQAARQPIAPATFDAARLISVHTPLRITSTPIAGKPQVKILSQPGAAMRPVDSGFAGS